MRCDAKISLNLVCVRLSDVADATSRSFEEGERDHGRRSSLLLLLSSILQAGRASTRSSVAFSSQSRFSPCLSVSSWPTPSGSWKEGSSEGLTDPTNSRRSHSLL